MVAGLSSPAHGFYSPCLFNQQKKNQIICKQGAGEIDKQQASKHCDKNE